MFPEPRLAPVTVKDKILLSPTQRLPKFRLDGFTDNDAAPPEVFTQMLNFPL